jgi:D-tyrosyl-tRNA(Tyr) deacylase
MIVVLQRVKEAAVYAGAKEVSRIGRGILVLLGVAKGDTGAEAVYLAKKTREFRMFDDADDRMNLCVADVKGEVLVVSQFTLLADGRKGRRPSFDKAAHPDEAERLYEIFLQELRNAGVSVFGGEFGAEMEVSLVNDGPVTFTFSRESEKAQ